MGGVILPPRLRAWCRLSPSCKTPAWKQRQIEKFTLMNAFYWTSLGVAGAMVATLLGTATLFPVPKTIGTARADFTTAASAKVRHAQAQTQPRDRAVPQGRMAAVLGYDLAAVIRGQGEVPRVRLVSLPRGLGRIRETAERKSVFFKTVLPLVLQVNEKILIDRKRLKQIDAEMKIGKKVAAVDHLWLAMMARRYGTRRGDVAALLLRHDIVPPSLALAQAATESAWGTSRFVKEGNAMFGQWTFSSSEKGLVPNARLEGQTHRVRAFDSLYDSVRSYIMNLNKHRAYKAFRATRAAMRRKGQTLSGARLAGALSRYSERGAAYVAELQAIIAGNNLELLDGARLRGAPETKPFI